MKCAHFVRVTPHASGLYESTREICKGQRDEGWDARLIDMEDILHAGAKAMVDTEERGVPVSNMEWAEKEADLHFLHSGIPGKMEGKKPLVMWMHGLPEYAYYGQMMMELYSSDSLIQSRATTSNPFNGSWTLCADYIPKRPYTLGCITCWPRHVHFWKHYFKNVIQIPHFVDQERFSPEGEVWKLTKKAESKGLNLLWADHWRYTAFKDPFQVIHGVADFCRATGSKLHLWALPCEYNDYLKKSHPIVHLTGHPWNIIYHAFEDILGNMFVVHDKMEEVYRAVDLVVTTSCDDTRLVLEAQACGTPVLTRPGTSSPFVVDWNHPDKVTTFLNWFLFNRVKAVRAFQNGAAARSEEFSVKHAAQKLNICLEKLMETRTT